MRTIPFGKPIIGDEEKAAISRVLDSGMLAHGPNVHAFEEAFAHACGGGHAVSVSSCTAAMHLVYFAWGFGPGNEVIVPAQTHTATAHAVELTGAKAVFVDAEPRTGNMDLAQLEAAITPRTRAIAVVHFLGMPVDMPAVLAIARRHQLKVVEDCALAIGTTIDGVHAGLHGDAGCFSFYPVKHITTAEGGMILTRDEALAKRCTHLRAFGMDKHVGQRSTPGLYDMLELGFNYRLNDVQAAIGIEQLKRLPGFLAARRANYDRLTAGLRRLKGITLLDSSTARLQSSYYCHSILLEPPLVPKRPELIAALKAAGIGTSIYYPCPVPHMTYYRQKYGYDATSTFPVAARISHHSIALPVGPHLKPDDVDYVAAQVAAALAGVA
jgi:dTDP-4-amino-4,6-dideoxygalactose transaminase